MVAFNRKRANFQQRRAISTIVGGAIFLILFASAFSTFFIAMDFQRDSINTQRAISESIMEKTKEQFSIAVSTDDSDLNRLGIQVKNQGTNPVEIGNIWIINKSGDYPAEKHLINYTDSIIPPGYGSDILNNTRLRLTVVDDYDIKVVSTLGTIKKAEYTLGAGNNLRAELIAIPPDVKVGQNVTMMMHVENIGYSRLLNVIPVNATGFAYPTITPKFTTAAPAEPSSVNLDPGEGVFFTWDFKTTGTPGSEVVFDSYATAVEEDTYFVMNSNVAVEKIELKEPDVTEVVVLTEDLLSRPGFFMTIPSPFGDGTQDSDKALWGANIVNPTGQPMDVNKVVISLISPRANNNDIMFNSGGGSQACAAETVAPTPDNWSCPESNQLMWENLSSPVTIPPYSVFPFNALVHPDKLAGSSDALSAVIVHGNVFTTVGEFGKAGYGSSFDNGKTSLASVYLSDAVDSTNKDDMRSEISGITSGSLVTFTVVLADLEPGLVHEIDDGSRLIINVPKGWVVDQPSIDGLGDFTTTYQEFGDTSSQIIGTLISDLNSGGATIQFDATAPTVTNQQMYVMYLLADGTIDDGAFGIGPLQEAVLQVVPP